MIYTRTSLPGNNPEANERLQASVARIQDDLSTSFFREYLRRMSERLEAQTGSGTSDMDVLKLSSLAPVQSLRGECPRGPDGP